MDKGRWRDLLDLSDSDYMRLWGNPWKGQLCSEWGKESTKNLTLCRKHCFFLRIMQTTLAKILTIFCFLVGIFTLVSFWIPVWYSGIYLVVPWEQAAC